MSSADGTYTRGNEGRGIRLPKCRSREWTWGQMTRYRPGDGREERHSFPCKGAMSHCKSGTPEVECGNIHPTEHPGSAIGLAVKDPRGPGAHMKLSPLPWYHTAYQQVREDQDLDLNQGSQ